MTTQAKSKSKTTLFDSLEQEAYLQLWRTYDRLREIEETLFSAQGISAQQYNALRLLKSAHPKKLPTSELSARLVSRAPDMTRLLDKLEELNLVARNRCATNRRLIEVVITEQGLAKLKSLGAEVRKCNRDQLGHLSQSKLDTLISILREARQPHEKDSNTNESWPGNF
jgi:DNA-binding MarR family transcriptional regulator